MKIEVTTRDIKNPSILGKLTLVLFGIFLTTLIFAFSIRILSTAGIWIGLLISLAITTAGYYYTEKGSRLRIITWSILVTILIGATIFIAGLGFLSDKLGEVL